jgi:uncharacterized protein YkwD
MRTISSRRDAEREATEGRGTTPRRRLLLAGAGVAVLTSVAFAGDATAGECPTGTSFWMPCRTTTPDSTGTAGVPTSPWSWWMPSPATAPPVTTPPTTAPTAAPQPVTPPAVTAPPVAAPPLPPVPQPVSEAARRLLELANQERQRAGLGALRMRDDVTSIALAHSHRMAEAGDIFHNRAYFSRATRRQLKTVFRGENVAYNSSVEIAHARLMRSPGHRANLLNRRFSVVGIAVVQAPDGRYFITQDFLQPVRPPRPTRR